MPDALDKLFPLPSTSFERYMIADDRISHPMAAFMEIDVRGSVDRQRLLDAFEPALDRHPLLRARIQNRGPLRTPYWVLTAPRPPDVANWDVPLSCPEGESLDLSSGTGMRTWIRMAAHRTRIVIQVHHACSDALGKLTFLADWLQLYTRLDAADRSPPLPDPNWDAFLRRCRPLSVPRDVRQNANPPGVVNDLYRFFHRPTVRLTGDRFISARDVAPLSGLYDVSVGDPVVQRIRLESRKHGVSVNDWLLAAMYVALDQWTEARITEPPRKVFRVTVPYNMRSDDALYSPASNQIGYEFLQHDMDAGRDFATLSRAISRHTGPVRKLRTSTFTKLLQFLKPCSSLFPFIAKHWEKSFGTVIFSNLGDVTELFGPLVAVENNRWTFGRLTVDRIACAPPTRPNTHLAMVVLKYAGRLHFVARCEGRVLAPHTVREFVDHYRSTVLNLLNVEDEAAPAASSTSSSHLSSMADSA